MHRRHLLLLLSLFTAFAAFLPAGLRAAPVVTALPTSKSAYLNTAQANVTFDIVAYGTVSTPTYQWGLIDGNGNFTSLTNTATYSGVTTANLTVNNTDLTLDNGGNGTKYKCKVTDGTTVSTPGVLLHVFNQPTVVPTLQLSTSTIAANSTVNLTITISNLTAGDQVKVQHYLDAKSNNLPNIEDPLLENFFVTENQTASFGGVTDPFIPGDDVVHTPNGTITTHINLSTASELSRVAGNHIVKINSPTGEFLPLMANFTVTEPAYGQSVSGQVQQISDNSAVPFSRVAILQQSGDNTQFVGGTVTDAGGNFTLTAPVGSNYVLLAFQPGNVALTTHAPTFSLIANQTLTGQNPGVTPATCMIGGKTEQNSVGQVSVAGLQLFVQGDTSNSVIIATSNNDGAFIAPVLADTYGLSGNNGGIDFSDNSVNQIGYLRPQNKPTADTTAGNSLNLTILLTPVNALIYGTVKNNSNVGLVGVTMDGNDNNNLNVNANTDVTGTYYMGVNAPVSGNNAVADNWNVSADNSNPALTGLVPPSSQNASLFAGQSAQLNFVTQAVTANLIGTAQLVNLDGSLVGNVGNLSMQADLQNSDNFAEVQSTTDSNGNFTLGVFAGSWNIQLNYSNNNNQGIATGNINGTPTGNLIGQSLTVANVTDGHDISNITFLVTNATNNITGNIVDSNNQPVSNQNVFGTATVNGTVLSINTQTDNSGHYTLPIANGNNTVPITWNISLNNGGSSTYYNQFILTNNTTASGNISLNFSPSPYLVWVNSNFDQNQQNNPSFSGTGATPGGDGIPNLVKFAFGLSPFVGSQSSLPHATIVNGKLSLAFTAANTDVTYTVQASTDLATWSTTGVTQSAP